MTLSEKIKQDFLSAMKNKELKKKNLIWLVKSEIDLIQKERSVTDWDVIKIVKKLAFNKRNMFQKRTFVSNNFFL